MSMVKIDKNAHRPVRLNITPEDAKKGKRLDPCACAAARAIKRQMGAGDDGVYVHRGVTYVKQGKEWVRFKTSGALRLETIIFDRGGEFAPGEYDIQAPPLSMISPKEPSKKRSPGIKSRNAFATRARRTVPGTRPTARGVEQEDSESGGNDGGHMPQGTPTNRDALLRMMEELEERMALLRGRDKQKDQLRRFIAKRPDLTRTDVRDIANEMPALRLISPHAKAQAEEKRRVTREAKKRKANGRGAASGRSKKKM